MEAMAKENRMKIKAKNMVLGALFVAAAMITSGALGTLLRAQTQPSPKPAMAAASTAAAPTGQGFATPKEAADAVIQAASDFDVPALVKILGKGSEDIVATKDTTQDKSRALAFAAKAKEKEQVDIDPTNKAVANLTVGDDEWPLPIPIVQRNGMWYFDTKAGGEEIVRRRIGANELDVITICRGYDDAQQEYALQIHDDSGVNQYAQRIVSTPGKHDGLAWQNPDGTWGGPVGEEAALAIAEGYSQNQPYHGYYFKVLKGQGPAAKLGKLDYVVNGAMIGGFALAAWPAEYRVTGVQTFIVSYDGVVYQKDLGPDTEKIASAMDRYNPDATWQVTEDADSDE
jgi:Protein of unknown function (DUF2950)